MDSFYSPRIIRAARTVTHWIKILDEALAFEVIYDGPQREMLVALPSFTRAPALPNKKCLTHWFKTLSEHISRGGIHIYSNRRLQASAPYEAELRRRSGQVYQHQYHNSRDAGQ